MSEYLDELAVKFLKKKDGLERQAKQGDASAQSTLAHHYESGIGVAQDHAKAVELYEEAAQGDDLDALCVLGMWYVEGVEVEQDLEKGRRLLERGAALRDDDSAMSLAMLRRRLDEQKNNALIDDNFWNLAMMWGDADYARTRWDLGMMLLTADGIKQDLQWGEWNLESAAERADDPEFACKLGKLYRDGCVIKQSYEKAFEWFREAALKSHAEAQCELGHLYYKGLGVEQDYWEASNWYERSAAQGFSSAQDALNNF